MKVYLAGPMKSLPAFNFPAFFAAEESFVAAGWEVVNPARMDTECDGFDPTRDRALSSEHYMRRDLPEVARCDAIALLPGWRGSEGAQNELTVARMCGLDVLDAETMEALREETILEEAGRLVHGDRGEAYGFPAEDFGRTGRMWGAILGIPDVPAPLVGLCMAALKLGREAHQHKRDNLADLAGYAETVQMIAEYEEEVA